MSTNKWLVGELQTLFGFQEVDEMASALLNNFPPNDPQNERTIYLEELLGKNSATQKLAQELASRLAIETDTSVRVGAKKKKKHINSNASVFIPKKTVSSYGAEQVENNQIEPQNKFPDKKLSQKEKARLNRQNQGNVQTGGIKISYEGKQRKNTTPAAPAMGDEEGDRLNFEMNVPPIQLTHSATPTGAGLIVNCLTCGYVNVVAAKGEKSKIWGECSFCGAYLDRGHDIITAPGFSSALELKNRLVQYDLASTERHAVYDDEADYYTSAAWLNELEQEELKKRDKQRYEKLHSRRRDMVVTIDLAGRRVVEEVDEGGLDAARMRYVQKNDSEVEKRHLENMAHLDTAATPKVPSSSGAGGGGGSGVGGGGGGGLFDANDRTEGGMFKNDTLTGRSRDVVESLTSLFDSLKNKQTTQACKQFTSKGSGAADQKKASHKSSDKSSEKAKKPSSTSATSVEDLSDHLAPWRKRTDHKQRVNFSYD